MQTHHTTPSRASSAPERYAAAERLRLAKLYRQKIGPQLKAQVWDRTKGICFYCGTELNPWRNFAIDHLHPISRGGTNAFENLVPCCRDCNSSKRDRPFEEWRAVLTKRDGGGFTDGQRQYLSEIGVDVAEPTPHEFWFERVLDMEVVTVYNHPEDEC